MASVAEQLNHIRQSATRVRTIVDEIERAYLLDCPSEFDDERRTAKRMRLTMPVVVTPLDDDLKPSRFLYDGITRDISYTGLSLATTNPEANRYVFLTLQPAHVGPFEIIGIARHCTHLGWYYRLGFEFLTTESTLGL